MVYLITGKQGAGKSTYAFHLVDELKKEGHKVYWLDGDAWRKKNENDDFTDKGRYKNLISAAKAAQDKEKEGYICVLSFIAPRKGWRDSMREHWKCSHIIYIPGGKLWEGTTYEKPDLEELCAVIHGRLLSVDGQYVQIKIKDEK